MQRDHHLMTSDFSSFWRQNGGASVAISMLGYYGYATGPRDATVARMSSRMSSNVVEDVI